MKEIQLTQGKVALVDDEDYEELMKCRWYALNCRGTYYARRNLPRDANGKRHAIGMHRAILSAPDGMCVDHINGDGLNNQRSNLRTCTHAENLMNAGKQKNNTSGFKGVRWDKVHNKWRAQIGFSCSTKYIGLFKTAEEAYKAYCEACVKYHGEFANTN